MYKIILRANNLITFCQILAFDRFYDYKRHDRYEGPVPEMDGTVL